MTALALLLIGWVTGLAIFAITVLAFVVVISRWADDEAGITRVHADHRMSPAKLVQRMLTFVRPH